MLCVSRNRSKKGSGKKWRPMLSSRKSKNEQPTVKVEDFRWVNNPASSNDDDAVDTDLTKQAVTLQDAAVACSLTSLESTDVESQPQLDVTVDTCQSERLSEQQVSSSCEVTTHDYSDVFEGSSVRGCCVFC